MSVCVSTATPSSKGVRGKHFTGHITELLTLYPCLKHDDPIKHEPKQSMLTRLEGKKKKARTRLAKNRKH